MPQITNARLLPTNMVAMNNWGRSAKNAMTWPRNDCCASNSVCSLLEATNAISMPEKKAEASSDAARIKRELEGSGSMKGVQRCLPRYGLPHWVFVPGCMRLRKMRRTRYQSQAMQGNNPKV